MSLSYILLIFNHNKVSFLFCIALIMILDEHILIYEHLLYWLIYFVCTQFQLNHSCMCVNLWNDKDAEADWLMVRSHLHDNHLTPPTPSRLFNCCEGMLHWPSEAAGCSLEAESLARTHLTDEISAHLVLSNNLCNFESSCDDGRRLSDGLINQQDLWLKTHHPHRGQGETEHTVALGKFEFWWMVLRK